MPGWRSCATRKEADLTHALATQAKELLRLLVKEIQVHDRRRVIPTYRIPAAVRATPSKVELNGALWNPLSTEKHGLSPLVKLVARTLQRPAPPRKSTVSPRIGEVKGAVVRALELADEPLSLGEIRRRCEEHLGRPVNASTVKDYVHKNARGTNPLFSRVGHGRYTRRLPD